MSTVVCQNIQSCFDTKSLSLKLNPPKPLDLTQTTTGWGCIESLSNSSIHQEDVTKKLEVYVHPLVKRSSTVLSEKSLEMCTENLGSETGTDIMEDDIFSMMSLDSEGEESTPIARERIVRKPRQKMEIACRKPGYESLPPPLTTMCGAHTIRVQPHRESGRLVMMAVTSTPRRSSIYAERSNGRLTMSLMEDFSDDLDEEAEEEEEEEVEEANVEFLCRECEEDEESVEEEDGQQEVLTLNGASVEEDIDEINKEVGDKFGINEFQRLSRCKEGGRGSRRFINWETFCVAT